jgi:hypothetical protein
MDSSILDRKELRKFGIITATMVSILFGLLLPFFLNKPIPQLPWIISGVLVLWALVAPITLNILYRPWMFFGHYMGLLNTTLILCAIFYLVFTPISIILKILGKDSMKRNSKREVTTFRSTNLKLQKEHMERNY